MPNEIIFVGRPFITGGDVTHIRFGESHSLLDGDIIVFAPDLDNFRHTYDTYEGLSCLGDDASASVKRARDHWKAELAECLKAGKTVIVFLTDEAELYVATGEKSYSGTGRNRHTTRHVALFDIYSALPLTIGKVVRRSGERVKKLRDLGSMAAYWAAVGEASPYEAYLDGFKGEIFLATQTGEKAVAGIIRGDQGRGTLIVLPPPDIDLLVQSEVERIEAGQRSASQSEQAVKKRVETASRLIAKTFVSALKELDASVTTSRDRTPTPAWVSESAYALTGELAMTASIENNRVAISELERERIRLLKELALERQLKDLLFEKGKPLERAIISGLRIMGFQADNVTEGDSEFDVIMTDDAGNRLIGEAEGKDDKAVAVDKLDQLDRNIREDFNRQPEDSAKHAHGVLFGNAYRYAPPDQRSETFTQKCVTAAGRSGISLVRTMDLFAVVQSLKKHPNESYAAQCRLAIIESGGRVVLFPPTP